MLIPNKFVVFRTNGDQRTKLEIKTIDVKIK